MGNTNSNRNWWWFASSCGWCSLENEGKRSEKLLLLTTAVNMQDNLGTHINGKKKYGEHSTEWKIKQEETIPKPSEVNGKFGFLSLQHGSSFYWESDYRWLWNKFPLHWSFYGNLWECLLISLWCLLAPCTVHAFRNWKQLVSVQE